MSLSLKEKIYNFLPKGRVYRGVVLKITEPERKFLVRFDCNGNIIEARTVERAGEGAEKRIGKKITIKYDRRNSSVCTIESIYISEFVWYLGAAAAILLLVYFN